MGKIFNRMVHELDFFLAFAILEVVVLHLVKNEQNAIETDLVYIVQECSCSRQATGHLLLLHDDFVLDEPIFNALKVLKQLKLFTFFLGYLICHFTS
jgi:hypothetical protein